MSSPNILHITGWQSCKLSEELGGEGARGEQLFDLVTSQDKSLMFVPCLGEFMAWHGMAWMIDG